MANYVKQGSETTTLPHIEYGGISERVTLHQVCYIPQYYCQLVVHSQSVPVSGVTSTTTTLLGMCYSRVCVQGTSSSNEDYVSVIQSYDKY